MQTSRQKRYQNKDGFFPRAAIFLVAGCFLYMAAGRPVRGDDAERQSTQPASVTAQKEETTAVFYSQSDVLAEQAAVGLPDDFLPTAATLDQIKDFDDIRKYLFYVDETAYADETLLDLDQLMAVDTKIKDSNPKEPKILIFHTHSQEDFKDSVPGAEDDTIVGVGSVLADILAEEYGIGVVHDFGQYDVVDGENVRGASYERMEPNVREILEKYPSIEVMIDLHRDGVPEDRHLITEINGEQVAQLMFFNGIVCERVGDVGEVIDDLPNPYLTENLGMSLKMQLAANERYPGLTRMLYLKPYRYSLHMRPKSLLVEAGANTNTVAEVKSAMKPLAEILYEVIR
jgi:stage II sporulation protein P